jgi:hypothetical protein
MSVASVNSVASVQSTSSNPYYSHTNTATTPPSTASGGKPTTTGGGVGGSRGSHSSRGSTTTSSRPSQTTGGGNGKKSSTNVAAVAGGVAGGVVGLALIALFAFFCVNRGVAKAEKNYGHGGGQGEKPTRELAFPSVGPLDGEYTPDAGAGADVGGGVHGVGVRKNPLTPELPGAAYSGGGGGGEGFNPAYAGAGYSAGAGAGAGAYYQVQDHNQGDTRYSIPASASPPGTDSNHPNRPTSAAYPSLQQPLPQSIPYGPHAAGALPPNHSRSVSGASPGFPLPINPPVLTTSDGTGGGPGTSLPYARTPSHDSRGYSSPGPAGSGGTPPGWAGLPEAQS